MGEEKTSVPTVTITAPAGRQRLSGGWLISFIVLVDAVSACWFGYCQGVYAGVLVSADFFRLFPQTKNANVSGIVTSCFMLGAFFGAIAAFISGDKLGRKKTIILGHTLNVIGAILQVFSWSLTQMVVGRVVNGFGIGITSTMSPVYLAECARSNVRGVLLVIGQSSNTLCFALANWISYGMYFSSGPFQWRFPLAFQLIFPLIVFPILMVVPESPRWLLLRNRDEDALIVITRLVGNVVESNGVMGPVIDDPLVTAEYRSIKGAIRLEEQTRTPLKDVLCMRDRTQNFRRLLLSCGTQFMQQFGGINALGFYYPTLLQENVGYGAQMSRLLTAVSSTGYLCAAFLSLYTVDKVGRRKLMLIGAILTGLCHLLASICLKIGAEDASKMKTMGSVAAAMFCLYYVFFAPTWGGIPWVYAAEVNSLGWRTRGAAAATAVNWIMAFVVVQITKVGIDNLKWGLYLIFAVLSFSFFPVVYFFYPETSRRSLEDMDQIFVRNPSWFVFAKGEMTQRDRPQALVDAELERIAQTDDSALQEQV